MTATEARRSARVIVDRGALGRAGQEPGRPEGRRRWVQLEAGHGEPGITGSRRQDPVARYGRGRHRFAAPARSTDIPAEPTGDRLSLHESGVAAIATTDVGAHRERSRSTRLQRVAVVLAPVAVLLVLRDVLDPGASAPDAPLPCLPAAHAAGHRPDHRARSWSWSSRCSAPAARRTSSTGPTRSTSASTTCGASEGLVEEVVKTLNLFLAHRTFAEQMGGSPRRAILFEGPPGTGKTYMAKAMAAEAGVPFLFVSSSAFQSMFYGQTNRKIRSYFKALRKLRPARGRRHRLHRGDRRHRRRPGGMGIGAAARASPGWSTSC